MLLPVFAVCADRRAGCLGARGRRHGALRRDGGVQIRGWYKTERVDPSVSLTAASSLYTRGQGRIQAAVFGLCRAQRVGRCRGDKTRVGILVYITHICIRHILSVERRRDIAVCFEKLYLSTVMIGLCQQKTRAIRQKSHCSSVPYMVKYPRKTGETSDSAES